MTTTIPDTVQTKLAEFESTGQIDCLVAILKECAHSGQHALGTLLTKPFFDQCTLHEQYLFHLGISAFYAGDPYLAYKCYVAACQLPLTEQQSAWHFSNARFSVPLLNLQSVTKTPRLHPQAPITVTMTTCKRLDLFQRTVRTFLAQCQDLDAIGAWIVVDDNSSAEDRAAMQQEFPWMQFIWKSPSEKGHAVSLNMLRDAVLKHRPHAPYILHLEDDWEFFTQLPYCRILVDILNDDPQCGQVLINREYAESVDDINLPLGTHHVTRAGTRYWKHVVDPERGGSLYWPHYSLRPGLIRKSVWETVGTYDVGPNFERKYAERYMARGYTTAMMEHIYCTHIGKRTNQPGVNAYALNDEVQFTDEHVEPPKFELPPIWVISLQRRADRLAAFQERFRTTLPGVPLMQLEAYDGAELKPSPAITELIGGNEFGSRRNILGCALSHLHLWCKLASADEHDVFCIFEDDAVLAPTFAETVDAAMKRTSGWDVYFLGISEYPGKARANGVYRYSTAEFLAESPGGTGGYLITFAGARKLLAYIQTRGLVCGIDTTMQRAADSMIVEVGWPHVISCPLPTADNIETVDTDIQRSFEPLPLAPLMLPTPGCFRLACSGQYTVSRVVNETDTSSREKRIG